ncbi:MAG: hypothetical protein MZV64_64390 [Ignavibacteriales bacterium]|nr:hypothetical protein [Ignavibacteriales bacterium]
MDPKLCGYLPGYSIFARSENDIWIAAGSVHHFNGTAWTEEAGIPGTGNAYKNLGATQMNYGLLVLMDLLLKETPMAVGQRLKVELILI